MEQVSISEERKLEEAERQLELDAAKFDNFLKENDRLAVDAIKQVCMQMNTISCYNFNFVGFM